MFFFVLTTSLSLPPHPGIPRVNGDCRPYPLRTQPTPHHSPHPWCVCLSGTGVQRSDRHLHLPADTRAVEPGCRTAGGLLHCHRPWLYLPLCRWLFRQWGHRHLRPAIHLLPLGMYTGHLMERCNIEESYTTSKLVGLFSFYLALHFEFFIQNLERHTGHLCPGNSMLHCKIFTIRWPLTVELKRSHVKGWIPPSQFT